MKINKSSTISQRCTKLDNRLYPRPIIMPDKSEITDVGDRIEYIRNRVAHGHWGDISSEAIFYGLMTAIIFHNQT